MSRASLRPLEVDTRIPPAPDHGRDPTCTAVCAADSGPFGRPHTSRSPEGPPGSHADLLPSAPAASQVPSWLHGGPGPRRKAEQSLGSVTWAQAGGPELSCWDRPWDRPGDFARCPMQPHFLIPHWSRATNQKPHQTDSRGAHRAVPKRAQACLNSREFQSSSNPRPPVGVKKQFPTHSVTWASE